MVQCMGHIQIRNVPEDVHRTLKARAAQKGVSLSDYLLAQVTELAQLPTLEEMTERVRSRSRVRLPKPAAELIREAREERERELDARS
jgi:plasmid stability protein